MCHVVLHISEELLFLLGVLEEGGLLPGPWDVRGCLHLLLPRRPSQPIPHFLHPCPWSHKASLGVDDIRSLGVRKSSNPVWSLEPRESVDAPPLKCPRPDLRNLVWWKVSHPMAGGWSEVIFTIPSNPNNYMISCHFIFPVFASLEWTRRNPFPGEGAGEDPHSAVAVLPARPMLLHKAQLPHNKAAT